MKYCMRCGKQLNDDDHFCPACGLAQSAFNTQQPRFSPLQYQHPPVPRQGPGFNAYSQPVYRGVPACTIPKKKPQTAVPLLVWSMIMVFIINPLGTPAAAVAAITAAIVNAEPDAPNAKRKTMTALLLCVAATAIDLATFILLGAAAAIMKAKGVEAFPYQ